jgi:hypothetical protein
MQNAIHAIAFDVVQQRREPSHPEYMRTNCPILNSLSEAYPSTIHGYSTTMMVSMFRLDYIVANVPFWEVARMISYIYTGCPVYRSAHDGMHRVSNDDDGQPSEITTEEIDDAIQELECDFLTVDVPETENYDDRTDDTNSPITVPPHSPVNSQPDSKSYPPLDTQPNRASTTPECKASNDAPKRKWTQEEDACILKYYQERGPNWRGMSRCLASTTHSLRSDDALRNRYGRLACYGRPDSDTSSHTQGASREKRTPWSEQEDEAIMQHVVNVKEIRKKAWKELEDVFPGRTAQAIRNRANRLLQRAQRNALSVSSVAASALLDLGAE